MITLLSGHTVLVFVGIPVLVIAVVAVALVLLVLQRVRHSPYGRVLRAIRDDDQVAAVAGKHVIRFKVEAFAVSAGILGLAGALWGHYTSYIAPEVFVPGIDHPDRAEGRRPRGDRARRERTVCAASHSLFPWGPKSARGCLARSRQCDDSWRAEAHVSRYSAKG